MYDEVAYEPEIGKAQTTQALGSLLSETMDLVVSAERSVEALIERVEGPRPETADTAMTPVGPSGMLGVAHALRTRSERVLKVLSALDERIGKLP